MTLRAFWKQSITRTFVYRSPGALPPLDQDASPSVAARPAAEQAVQKKLIQGWLVRLGRAGSISLPDIGIEGNSHMFMQYMNNLQVADLIVNWVSEHVDNKNR